MKLGKLFTSTIVGAGLMVGSTAAMAETTLTIVSWGGAYSASQQKAYHDPYMAANPDIKIVNDDSASEGLAKLRAQVEAGNVTWDLVDMEAPAAITACEEGIAEPINPDKDLAMTPDGIVASMDFIKGSFVSECFIPQIVYSTTLGYRNDVFGGNNPSTIADVFDLANFPGKRALEKRPDTNMEWALIADGVPAADVYKVLDTEEGIKRAFAKLDTIKDSVIWWSAGADTPQLLADGEVVMGSTYNGRLFALIEEKKQPVAMLWDAQVYDIDGWIIPAGLSEERKARALDYIMFATDTQRLADQAKYISYGPARASSAPLVGMHAELGIDMAPHMPTDPNNAKNTFLYNYEFWADYRDDIDAKFQAWLAK